MRPVRARQMGFGDVQVPGYLPPKVNTSAEVATETDLTYIAPPPGTPVPLEICSDRAPPSLPRSQTPTLTHCPLDRTWLAMQALLRRLKVTPSSGASNSSLVPVMTLLLNEPLYRELRSTCIWS